MSTVTWLFPYFSIGTYCETISECSVLCEHGRCPNKPDECECESSWGPPGNCSIYGGPCLNCSSVGGTCKKGPNTCECKPGLIFRDCDERGLFNNEAPCQRPVLKNTTHMKIRASNYNVQKILGPVQTPLHSCAEPNWWIKSGKRAASESVRYGSFNSAWQRY